MDSEKLAAQYSIPNVTMEVPCQIASTSIRISRNCDENDQYAAAPSSSQVGPIREETSRSVELSPPLSAMHVRNGHRIRPPVVVLFLLCLFPLIADVFCLVLFFYLSKVGFFEVLSGVIISRYIAIAFASLGVIFVLILSLLSIFSILWLFPAVLSLVSAIFLAVVDNRVMGENAFRGLFYAVPVLGLASLGYMYITLLVLIPLVHYLYQRDKEGETAENSVCGVHISLRMAHPYRMLNFLSLISCLITVGIYYRLSLDVLFLFKLSELRIAAIAQTIFSVSAVIVLIVIEFGDKSSYAGCGLSAAAVNAVLGGSIMAFYCFRRSNGAYVTPLAHTVAGIIAAAGVGNVVGELAVGLTRRFGRKAEWV